MKTYKILIPILGLLAALNGALPAYAIVDPLYYTETQKAPTEVDTTLGASVTSTTPTVLAVDPAPAPAPSPSPSPSPSPTPPPAHPAAEEQVLGVTTEKDHSKEYYEDLKARLMTLQMGQQTLISEQQRMNNAVANPMNQLPLFLVCLTLAIVALFAEWRYQRLLQRSAALQKVRKSHKRK